MNPSSCYIVRIYRRDEHDACNVVGVVETIDAGGKKPFKSPEELWKIVGKPAAGRKPGRVNNPTRIKRTIK